MDSFSGLLSNSALMMILCVIYDTFNLHAIPRKEVRDGVTGLIVGLIAIAVMLTPWSIYPGVFFDTRWVLLSLCGLFFGVTPTLIAVVMAGAFRLYMGGAGGVVGTVVIVSTACTGLAWRYYQQKYSKPLGWVQLYLFGVLVQLVMLGCMFLMPKNMIYKILETVAPPILIIYPVLTMILGMILKRQQERRKTDQALLKEVKERKAAEQEARKSKEEWEKTFNSFTDVVTLQDTNFRIVKINQAGCDLFRLKNEDIVGRYCYSLFMEEDECCPECPLINVVKKNEPSAAEIYSDKSGKTFLVSGSPVLDENGVLAHLTHVAKDITDKKKLEKNLFQAQKMESIGTLAGGIAHDFNNILSVIMGYAELARQDLPEDSRAFDEINQIIRSSQRAADLVRHILTFSRKSEHHLQSFTPGPVVKDALKMLRASLPVSIKIFEDIDDECGNIIADTTNIHQIVINLCTNAVHAMENEKGTLSIRLYREDLDETQIEREKGESPGSFVALEIKDTGHGMTPETMASIFDPFFTTKGVGKGTGLGLSVVHGIVKDYEGFIRVYSKPGAGTTFKVFFPLAIEDQAGQTDMADGKKDPPAGNGNILFVDDEAQIARMNKISLEKLGYSVTAMTDSVLALETIRSHPHQFDLVISDQTMPGISGSDLARQVFDFRPDMPFVLCTGHSAVFTESDAISLGIRKYLQKPVTMKQMAQTVNEVLA